MKKKLLCLLICQQAFSENITIYNSDIALINDNRQIELKQGLNQIEIPNISANIQPETVQITGNQPLNVLEQNFNYDLLSEEALLNKFIGKQIKIKKENGEIETATLLANNNGVILQYENRIESGIAENASFVFPEIPANFSSQPTLNIDLEAAETKNTDISITYLSSGLNWNADYVVDLVEDKLLNINGWVTLRNQSGKTYENANLQLAAGDINRVRRHFGDAMMRKAVPMAAVEEAMPTMEEESLGDLHLYTLQRPTTIANNQSKQVALTQVSNLPFERVYEIRGSAAHKNDESQKATVLLEFKNDKPLPAGVMRIYQKDSKGTRQFIGEDNIKHTAENEKIKLVIGNAFDIYAEAKQTEYKRIENVIKQDKEQVTNEIKLVNRKNEDVSVNVKEFIPREWKIVEENFKHEKYSSSEATWNIKIPAKSDVTLKYTVTF